MQGAKNSRVLDPAKFLKITKVGLRNPTVVGKLNRGGAVDKAVRVVAQGAEFEFEGLPLKPSFWVQGRLARSYGSPVSSSFSLSWPPPGLRKCERLGAQGRVGPGRAVWDQGARDAPIGWALANLSLYPFVAQHR